MKYDPESNLIIIDDYLTDHIPESGGRVVDDERATIINKAWHEKPIHEIVNKPSLVNRSKIEKTN